MSAPIPFVRTHTLDFRDDKGWILDNSKKLKVGVNAWNLLHYNIVYPASEWWQRNSVDSYKKLLEKGHNVTDVRPWNLIITPSGLEVIVDFLENRGLPRTLGVVLIFLLAIPNISYSTISSLVAATNFDAFLIINRPKTFIKRAFNLFLCFRCAVITICRQFSPPIRHHRRCFQHWHQH